MKPRTVFLLLFQLVFGISTYSQRVDSSQQKDHSPKPLPVNWARAHQSDIKHIAIDLHFDWLKKQAYGTTTIVLSPLKQTDRISLDAGMLIIHTIVTDKGTALKFDYDGSDNNDALNIKLDRIYKPSEEITFTIKYHTTYVNDSDPTNIWGSYGKGIRFFEPTTTEPKRRKQAWSVGEPESNRYWFPCYDYPNDLRTTDFTATVEKPLMVISNGSLVNVKDNPDGTRTYHWSMATPYANHLTSFVIGEYTDVQQVYKGIVLHSYSYPDEVDATAASVVRLPDMVKFYSEKTGLNYPYASYSQVFVQEFPAWMGNMTASTITENMVDDESTHGDYFYLWDITEAEALAQQWFGNSSTVHSWEHTWLNKSFCHYFSGLYNEYKNGSDEFLSYQLSPCHNAYLADWQAGFRQPVVNRNYEHTVDFTGSSHPYFYGASVLHMLRKHLGEETWWKAIRLYVKENANRSVSTEDFRKAVEEASGEPMDWFFDQWLYKIGYPVFEVTKTYDATKKQLLLSVKQTQTTDPTNAYPQAVFFRGKVELEIDTEIKTLWLEARALNTFTISCLQEPALVNFDYQSTWTKELVFKKTIAEWTYQFRNSKDILARMAAMTELAAIAKTETTTVTDKQKIKEAFRFVIESKAYWRLRASVLSQLQGILLAENPGKALAIDKETRELLLNTIQRDSSWVRTNAIRLLGMSKDKAYTDIYLKALSDKSDRVVNAAAIALGKTKSPKAFDALIALKEKPSWKNQSLISALNGLKELGDTRAEDFALKALTDSKAAHWTLATSTWDHRLAAAETLVSLGKVEKAYPLILEQFKQAIKENNNNDIFYNTLQVSLLADARGTEVFDILKSTFKGDENALAAATQLEVQFTDNMKKATVKK